jgi:hypothetical protein
MLLFTNFSQWLPLNAVIDLVDSLQFPSYLSRPNCLLENLHGCHRFPIDKDKDSELLK